MAAPSFPDRRLGAVHAWRITMAKAAKAKKPVKEETVIEIQEIQTQEARFNVLGTSPLIMHRFPFKAWQELILPARKENRAALEQTLKHLPIEEYRESFYRNSNPKAKTLFHVPNRMFACAIAQAAVDIPGAARAQIERLTRVTDINIELFGVPQIFCAMVRNSGMNRSPDVRTRPIFPQWACRVTVRFVVPILTERNVLHLAGAAGLIVGIGDWRGQKVAPYVAFRIVNSDDREVKHVMKQDRRSQQSAYDAPVYHDEDTEAILSWFDAELRRREQDGSAQQRRRRGNGPKTKKVHVVDGSEKDESF